VNGRRIVGARLQRDSHADPSASIWVCSDSRGCVVWCVGGVRGEDPRSDNTNSGKEQQSEWAPSRRGSWSDILGVPQRRRTTSFVIMYALSSFITTKQHPRPRVVVMLSLVSPSDSSIESNKCRAKIPVCVKALKRADIVLDWGVRRTIHYDSKTVSVWRTGSRDSQPHEITCDTVKFNTVFG
jgi:hypothetical protein